MKSHINPHAALSKREEQVLELVILSYTTDQIADMLYISHSTANTHVRNIKLKTGAQKNTDLSLIWFCRTQGITMGELLRKRILPVILFIGLQMFSTFSGTDMCRLSRSGRSTRGRRHEVENPISI